MTHPAIWGLNDRRSPRNQPVRYAGGSSLMLTSRANPPLIVVHQLCRWRADDAFIDNRAKRSWREGSLTRAQTVSSLFSSPSLSSSVERCIWTACRTSVFKMPAISVPI